MTCIAGAIKKGELCIGGDTASTSRKDNVRMGAHSKVFVLGEFLIGSSGTVRTHQIAQYLFEPPEIDGDLMTYMVKLFASSLRIAMKEEGGEETVNGNLEMNARLLVGIRGRLFIVDSGYGVFEASANYAAVGCADQEALSGMFTANSLLENATAEDIARYGLLAAAEFDSNIRPPFTVLKLGGA
jgi:ATP-dependent protease HslVU (ClpYQ) peptidase subunit